MDCAIKVDGKSVPAADRLKLLGATPSTCSFTSGPIAAVSAPECAPDPAASQADSAALGTRGTTALRCSVWIRPWSAGARGRHLAPGDATIPRGTPPKGDAGGDPYITGCPLFIPAHAVMVKSGLMPVPAGRPARRAGSEALRQGARAPRGQALRTIAEDGPPSRLKSVTGWRGVGHETWRAAGIISDSCSCRQSPVTSVCGARVQDGGRR